MIDKDLLENISKLHEELNDLEDRLNKITKTETTVIKDSVQGSSTEYPYIQHNCVIEGVRYPKTKKSRYIYKKQIKSKRHKLDKLINQLEYELNYIEDKDSEIRKIIRHKYEDNLSWIQIMFKMKYNSESTAKMKLKRFFEENLKCDKCDDIM